MAESKPKTESRTRKTTFQDILQTAEEHLNYSDAEEFRTLTLESLKDWAQSPKIFIYHQIKVLLLLLKHATSDDFDLSLRVLWACECVTKCEKMLEEDNPGKSTHARLMMEDLLDEAEKLRSLAADEEHAIEPDMLDDPRSQRDSRKRSRGDLGDGEEDLQRGLKRLQMGDKESNKFEAENNQALILYKPIKEVKSNTQLMRYPVQEESESEKEENSPAEKEITDYFVPPRKRYLVKLPIKKSSLASRISIPEEMLKTWKIYLDDETDQWTYDKKVHLREDELKTIKIFLWLYEKRPEDMEELMQVMGVDAGILEGMDLETAKQKAHEGELLIYSLDQRMKHLQVACGDADNEDGFADDDSDDEKHSTYEDDEEEESDDEFDPRRRSGRQIDLLARNNG